MKDRFAKLIDVKSIVTILLTILFFVLAIKGIIDGASVLNIYTVVIAFYFGTQFQKKNTEDTEVAEIPAEQQVEQQVEQNEEPIRPSVIGFQHPNKEEEEEVEENDKR